MNKIIGNYEYNPSDWLGSGSFATVFKGYNVKTRNPVAIKEFDMRKLQRIKSSEKQGNNIEAEIKIMECLVHPNILRFEEIIHEKDYMYVILEYCDGGDLSMFLNAYHQKHMKFKGMNVNDVQIIACQIASGLKHMHNMGIIHRDLKPSNILLSNRVIPNKTDWSDIIIKIADFGFAKKLGTCQMTETICGSPMYMSPEILRLNKYTNKTDLWSFGIILYELLVGHVPFQAQCVQELCQYYKGNPIILLPSKISVPKSCRDLIESLLIIDPIHRISWEDFCENNWLISTRLPRYIQESRVFDC